MEPDQPVPDAALRFLARALDACCMAAWLPGVWGYRAGELLLSRVHGWRFALAAQLGERITEPIPFHPRVRVLPERGRRRRRGGGPDGPCRPQQGSDFGGPR